MSYLVSRKDFIAHHGILGMKWGVRRFQNKDGSLTEAGKKRYGNASDISTSVSKRAFDSYAKDLDAMEGASERFNNLGNELAKDYSAYYSDLKNNEKFKLELYKSLYEDFGGGVDDLELLELVVDEKLDASLPKSLKDKVKDFYDAGDEYFNTLEKIADPFIQEYKNQGIEEVKMQARSTAEPIDTFIKETLTSSNLQWNAYMYRHFDDYWVRDVDTRYELVNDLVNGYNDWAEEQ